MCKTTEAAAPDAGHYNIPPTQVKGLWEGIVLAGPESWIPAFAGMTGPVAGMTEGGQVGVVWAGGVW